MKARILIVEDNAANLELARYLLAAGGHDILLATNGQEALAIARAERPQLIVSDLQMPVMDGYALIAELRRDALLYAIPVVALTASSMSGDESQVMQAGFNGYLSKPLDPEIFTLQVEKILLDQRGA